MEPQEPTEAPGRPRRALYGLAVVAVLYLAREVLIPVALAILLTFIVAPLVAWIERRVRSRALAVLLATLLVTVLFGGALLFAGQQFGGLADELPTYRDTIVRKVRSIQAGPGGVVGRAAESIRQMGDDIARAPDEPPFVGPPSPDAPTTDQPTAPAQAAPVGPVRPPAPVDERSPPGASSPLGWTIMGSVLGPLGSAMIVILLLVMMLMSRENIRDRLIRLAGLHQIGFTTQTLEEAGVRVGKYLRVQLLMNAVYAVLIGAVLLVLGVPNAILCGLIAGVVRFIPILGPWIAAAIPAALALAVFDDWYHVFIVIGFFAVLEIIDNFIIEPWLYGASTGLSSFGVILAIIFWTWIWGAVGLVLAMPITVCLVVFTRHVPHLSALWILLGDEPVLSDSMRYYQRLLCRDEDEAAAILAAAPADADPVDILDQVVVPSLSAARADLRRGLITGAQAARIGAAARELALEWLTDRDVGRVIPTREKPTGGVVCLPAHDGLDEAAAAVLTDLLRRDGVGATAISAGLLFSEKMAATEVAGVNLVVVSSVGPSSDLQTRRICKTLQQKLPGTPVIVVAWVDDAPGTPPATETAPATIHTQVSTNRQVITLVKSLLTVQPSRDPPVGPAKSGS